MKNNFLRPWSMTRVLFISKQRDQYIQHYQFALFIASFPNQAFIYLILILKVDIIECKTKGSTVAYLFTLVMASKNTIIGNINIFEELNVNQQGLLRKNPLFGKLFTT